VPLPLIVLGPVAVAIAGGVAGGVKGLHDIVTARAMANEARLAHEAALRELESHQGPVHARVAEYGRRQLAAVSDTVGSFADWIERNHMAVKRLGQEFVAGIGVTAVELPDLQNEVALARNWIAGGIAGATVAAAAPEAALLGVSALATASTGTAISSLSGAAATNATLAWLGGGPLAFGGGGMAAGASALGLIAAAPAVFVGGLTAAVIGSKQKTNAREYAAEVSVAIEIIQSATALLPKLVARVDELDSVLERLEQRAQASIAHLESLKFDPDQHGADFLRALQLVRGIREVVNTPVLDRETGELTAVSLRIVRKHT
jgi:hypothetical protein